MKNVKLNDGTVRCGDHMDASFYESETDEACLYCPAAPTCNEVYGCDCKDCERVTHLGGTAASAACTDIEPGDAFSSAKASVDCDSCLSAIERTTKGGQRYQVDYDESRHSWGVVDTLNGDKFVSHTTTLTGARVQRRRIASYNY